MQPRTRTRLADVLAKQQHVISFGQVVEAGVDPHLPAREVAAKRWQLMCRGIYLASIDPATDEQRAWCAQLAGGEGAVVTGAVACRLHGVADVPDVSMAALVECDRQRSPGDDVVCLRTAREAFVRERDDGIRLADVTRAVIDTARMTQSLRDVRALVMAAMNGGHTVASLLRKELDAGPQRGSALSRRALDDWDDGARSAPEAEAADWLREEARARRCPPFLLNPVLYLDGVRIGSPDVYVVGTGLGNEMDSKRHHGAADDLDATLSRHAVFAAAGVSLEHITPHRFRRDPSRWASNFAAVARQRLGQEPPGLVVVPVGPEQPVRGRRRRSPRSR